MDDDKKKPVDLKKIIGNAKTNQTKENISNMVANFPLLIQYQVMVAQLQWAKYVALRGQGFTEQQALELCRTIV